MATELGVFLSFSGILILIFLLGRALLVPIKVILRMLLNSLIGALLIVIINVIGTYFGIIIPLNVFTAVTIGILGIPGVIILLILFV